MIAPFGFTRSVITSRYALFTPEGFVASPLPGWTNAQCVTIIAPQLGACFHQFMITLMQDGAGTGETADRELVVFVHSGSVRVDYSDSSIPDSGRRQQLTTGGYCYLPPGHSYDIQATAGEVRLIIFERTYIPLSGTPPPVALAGQEQEVAGVPFMGDEDALLKTLLPDMPAFDMAVNIFTFKPGATLPMVETHIMEHGLVMLQGQGIYRLDNDWHPVRAGDVIWMGPYCPQWFVAAGKVPARYIYYKDVNRL